MKRFATLLTTILLVVCMAAAWAYNPPTSSSSPASSPKTHGIIALKALDVLQADGKSAARSFYSSNLNDLLRGTREADTGGGSFSVAGSSVDKNSFTHFHNPLTGKGFVLSLGEYNGVIGAISYLSLAPWKYFTMKGPHPSMADMADWYYAQAVQQMRSGNKGKALEYLGYVLHYASDATVPQHVTDEGAQKPGSQHVEYENACDQYTANSAFPHATFGGTYRAVSFTPGNYIIDAANFADDYLSKAKNPSQFGLAANAMIPLAERYCAALLDRFFNNWQNENFKVVVVTIDRLKAKTYMIPGRSLDSPDQADLYAYVTVDGRQYDTGVVDGCDDMSPNSFIPYAWVFPKWISGKSSVQIKFAVWDDDGVTGDDKAYICPKSGEKELWINYDLNSGAISGDTSASASGNTTSGHTSGNHSSGDEAEIWFKVQRWP